MRRTAGHFEALLAVCAAALAAGCDEATHPAPREEQRATNSVAYLKSLCDGRNSVVVTQEITVQGYVAANDRYGEFTKSLVIEDATGGITVAADLESVADVCPFGYVATLRCHGLVLCDYGGKIQIGVAPEGSGAGRIPAEDFARYVSIRMPEADEGLRAEAVTIDRIAERHIDTRVRIDGVHFPQAGAKWCDTDPQTGRSVTTERTLADDEGHTLPVRTAGTCTYAKEPIPAGTGSIYGVIDYFDGKYTLRVTNRTSCFRRTVSDVRDGVGEYIAAGRAPADQRWSASQSISFSCRIFSPDTEEMNTAGTPSGRCARISRISPSSSMSHLVTASNRSLSSSSGLYCVSSPSRMS